MTDFFHKRLFFMELQCTNYEDLHYITFLNRVLLRVSRVHFVSKHSPWQVLPLE
jgi:hypothetical protein